MCASVSVSVPVSVCVRVSVSLCLCVLAQFRTVDVRGLYLYDSFLDRIRVRLFVFESCLVSQGFLTGCRGEGPRGGDHT